MKVSRDFFELPLLTPILVQGQTMTVRRGLLITLEDASGAKGYGECMPLPGLHSETIEDCNEILKKQLPRLATLPNPPSKLDLELPYFGIKKTPENLPPSLEFALEQALLTLALKRDPSIIRSIFKIKSDPFKTEINGLIIPDQNLLSETPNSLETKFGNSFQTLKVKVGRFHPNDEIDFLKKINQIKQGSLRLRLDGNRLFSEQSYLKFSDQLKDLPIEYFEEPLQPHLMERSSKIYDQSPFPIALDETLPYYQDRILRGLALPKSVTTLVIKPTTLGGIHKTIQLIQLSQDLNLNCVLSSAFDSGWTITTHALIAQLIHPITAMGLDTYRFLKQDILQIKLNLSHGYLDLETEFWVRNQPVLCSSRKPDE